MAFTYFEGPAKKPAVAKAALSLPKPSVSGMKPKLPGGLTIKAKPTMPSFKHPFGGLFGKKKKYVTHDSYGNKVTFKHKNIDKQRPVAGVNAVTKAVRAMQAGNQDEARRLLRFSAGLSPTP